MPATLYSKREQTRMRTEHNIEVATWILAGVIALFAILIVMALVYNLLMGFW